jgi:FtsP/CotA-like multicopper oxidase with cupredoxin domain
MQRRKFVELMGLGSLITLVAPQMLLTSCNKQNTIINPSIFDVPLPLLPEATNVANLVAQPTIAQVFGNEKTIVWSFMDNSMLAPTFRVNTGTQVDVQYKNKLTQKSNIHWHGLLIPANMDGNPRDVSLEKIGTFNYKFDVAQRAGASWYHPHAHSTTGEQVYRGLAGLFIVNDAEEQALNLPSGAYEIPLIIQDKRTNDAQTELDYSPNMADEMQGYLGENIVTNGKHQCFLDVETRFYRFRILNASNSRVYNLALNNGQDFWVIGNDGGLLPTPEKTNTMMISSGERADILIDFGNIPIGETLRLQSKKFEGGGKYQGVQAFDILQLNIKTQTTDAFTLPNILSNITALMPANAAKTRVFDIANKGMMMNGHKINKQKYEANTIAETVKYNDIEIWEFDNTDGNEPHPMHIHGVQFQVLNRTGGRNAVQPYEKGWKDTVLMMPEEKVQVIMRFEAHKGLFLLHCHNLEHSDTGMMLNYEIV